MSDTEERALRRNMPSAVDLHHWAVNVMKFSSGRHGTTRTPTPDEFNEILRGPLVEVWSYVISHVHAKQSTKISVFGDQINRKKKIVNCFNPGAGVAIVIESIIVYRHVRKVKGNLQLRSKSDITNQMGGGDYKVKYHSDKIYDKERAALEERANSLSVGLANHMTAICQVEQHLVRLRNEITTSENAYQLSLTNHKDTNQRRALLHALSQRANDDVCKIQEFTTRVSDWSARLDQQRSGHGQSTIETVCVKEVRECCELIGRFLTSMLSQTADGDKTALDRHRAELWRSVEVLSRSYSPAQLLAAVRAHVQDTAADLREHTVRINVREDAEKLRFKYTSSGKLSDLSSTPSDLRTVRQLLEEYEAASVNKFLEMEKSRNAAIRQQQRLRQSADIINGLLRKQAGDGSGALQLMRNVYDTELEISVSRSVISLLESVCSELQQLITTASLQKQILYAKYNKIQDFQKIVESKQSQIGVLVKQNKKSTRKLEEQQIEIRQYIESVIRGQENRSCDFTAQLNNAITAEVDSFARLVLPYLRYTTFDDGQRVCTVDLSIYRLVNNSLTPGSQSIDTVLKNLQFPSYKSPDCLLAHVVRLHTEHVNSIPRSLSQDGDSFSLSPSTTDVGRRQQITELVANICSQAESSDRSQIDKLLPLLNKHQSQITDSLTACLHVKDLVSDWWDQPAQNCTPWITVDGQRVQQWKDNWTVLITRIRQGKFPQSRPS